MGLNAETVADRLTETTGRRWAVEGRCPGGEVGAYFVTADDHRYVMKWSERPGALGDLGATVERLRPLHARGFPMPLYEPPIPIGDAVVVVQARVEHGQAMDQVSTALVDQLLNVAGLKVGVTEPSDDWTRFMRTTLLEGADGWCVHQSLAEHSADTRAILHWATGIGHDIGSLPSGDLVHVDFHHRNVLQTATDLVAVIDWEGATPGDHVFDLVTLVFNLVVAEVDPGVERRLWNEIESSGEADAVAAYVAHMSIRQLDWQIRHHPASVDLWVEKARHVRRQLG